MKWPFKSLQIGKEWAVFAAATYLASSVQCFAQAEIRAILDVGRSQNIVLQSSGVDDPLLAPPIFRGDSFEQDNVGSANGSNTRLSNFVHAIAGVTIPNYSTFQVAVSSFATGGASAFTGERAGSDLDIEDRLHFTLPDGSPPTQAYTVRIEYFTPCQSALVSPINNFARGNARS